MSKLYRSLLWSGLLVAGITACGDDVTIGGGEVTSVTVGPSGVTLGVGQTLQMAAAVNAASGVATTVTWSTSNAATASVSATGLVTGVAAGSVAITACSTVNTSVCGQATVTVTASAPAVISIKTITNTVVGTGEVPVNINNVAGQINVTMNLDAGGQQVQNVQVLVDGAVACQQGFSGIQEATARAQQALLMAGDPNAALVVEITCPVNTAEFNPTTGVAKYLNGAHLVSARVNLVGSAPVATPSTSLVFNNASGFVVSLTANNGTDPSSAIDPRTGLQWLGGSITLNFIGVSYVAGGVTISNVSLPLFGKTISSALTAGVGSITFSEGTTWTAANTGLGNYLSPAAGEPVPIGTAVLSNGQTLVVPNAILNVTTSPAGATTIAPLQVIRVDNTAPGANSANGIAQAPITLAAMSGVWVNATTSFAAGQLGVPSLSSLNSITAGTGNDPEEGVDAIVVTFHATPDGGTLPAGCSITGLTAVTTGSNLTASTVSTAFTVRVLFKDALGNISCQNLVPATGTTIGADFTAPTGTITAGPAAGPPGLNVDPGSFSVTASDNASGFLATPLLVIMTRLNANNTTTCVIGSGTGCVTPGAQPLTFDATGAVGNIEGYYTTSITLVDQAGNQTVLLTNRLYEYDATNPGFSGGISLPALISGAATNTFAATATDNMDLNSIFGDVAYPLATLRYPSQSVGSWGTPLEQSAAVSYAVANWVRCINAAGSFAVASGQPTGITLTVSDQALNTFSLASAAFGANAQACTGSVGNIAAADILSFTQSAPNYGAGKTQVDIDGASLAAASSTTVTLTAVADVALNSAADPFTRVDFYMVSGGVHIKIGTGTAVLSQTITNRFYTYTFVWDPAAPLPASPITVVALGVDAQGDAVFTGTQTVTTVP